MSHSFEIFMQYLAISGWVEIFMVLFLAFGLLVGQYIDYIVERITNA